MYRLNRILGLFVACGLLASCGDDGADPDIIDASIELERRSSPSAADFDACMFASPQSWTDAAGTEAFVVAASDKVALIDPDDGSLVAEVTLPAPEGERPFVIATPALVGDLLVVAYHTTPAESEPREVGDARLRHLAAVVNLEERAIDERFPWVEIDGVFQTFESVAFPFEPQRGISRGALVHLAEGEELGRVYVTFGNVRDIQPWHGFIFALDLDAWQQDAAGAVADSFVTTAVDDCGPDGQSGSRDRRCGGGLWSPSGPLVREGEDGPELILPPGNGEFDLSREAYANTLMRVSAELEFESGCDEELCADFDRDFPAEACVASCENLWVPQQLEEAPLPINDACTEDGSLFACWGAMDYIGGSTPVEAELGALSLLAYPTKDGAIYLVDAENLAQQYDRFQAFDVCGTEEDPCRWDWAGMMVTQPALTEIDGDPVVIVAGFMPDNTHDAGVSALRIVEDGEGGARFEQLWNYPERGSSEAQQRFREHPSRPLITQHGERELVWVLEARRGEQGRLLALNTSDGEPVADIALPVPGYRFTLPAFAADTLAFPSCSSEAGPSHLELWRVTER